MSLVSVVKAVATLFSLSTSSVSDCAAGKSVFQINSQGFSPEPPVAGENVTLWIDYTVPEGVTVNGGNAKYSITYNGIPFPSSSEDLCTQITCPQVPGTYNITSTSEWPSGLSGKIVTKIQWYDESGNELLCSQTTEKTLLLRGGNKDEL